MNAIRKSNDRVRSLDAFWDTQIQSKIWLIKKLKRYVSTQSTIEIHGGWVGLLASLLFQSKIKISNIVNIDIDPSCELIANEINNKEIDENKFKHITLDMVEYKSTSDIIINTSCEHVTQETYNHWLNNINFNQLVVLQSNNFEISEHIRVSKNLNEFIAQSKLSNILYKGTLKLPMYRRFMLIGYR
jgi:hypothetical protein